MEYVEEGELFELIVRRGRLEEEEACRYFKHLVSAVAYLHQLNIVHRDLKPENLLVDWKGGLKVVDFGLSNTYQPGELLKTACGSPCYAAPEMISSKKYLGLDVDVWSCGVILFAMVCGYLPFEDSNTSLLYKKILSGEYVLPLGVSPAFKDLLSKVLCIDPSRRARVEDIFSH
jgi:5'-AMP-activated protein kinase, catalytic alpha subunit